jgi:lipoprotein-anchoring transpeptidase ErfK/SrfK
VVRFDPAAAQAGLEAVSAQVRIPAQDAALSVEGGQVLVSPAVPGQAIAVEATLAALSADPQGVLLSATLPLTLEPLPPRLTDVSAAAAEAERLLNARVALAGYDPVTDEYFDWEVPPEVVRSWVEVQPGEAGPRVFYAQERVRAWIGSFGESLGEARWLDAAQSGDELVRAIVAGEETPTLLVRHRPTTYVVQPGDTLISIGWKVGMPYWKIVDANPGLDQEALWAGLELTIPSKDELLPLPVVLGKRIVISIGDQRLRVYQDGELLSEHVISTGIDRSPTQPGVFQVQTHELEAYASVWDLYMPHFLGIYEAWPGFLNGIHGLPTLSNGRRLWESILGRPASYGCIILDLETAEWLYDWAENGVVVEIQA